MAHHTATATAHPSLALIKYWGKQPGGVNIPATTSVAVTLRQLATVTNVVLDDHERAETLVKTEVNEPVATTLPIEESEAAAQATGHRNGANWSFRVSVDGRVQPAERYEAFFHALIQAVQTGAPVDRQFTLVAQSRNSFPTAAGLASSASGFAALAAAAATTLSSVGTRAVAGNQNGRSPFQLSPQHLSELARVGSGSAARSVFGGFTVFRAGAAFAEQLRDHTWWPDLRIVVVPVSTQGKPVSSREAMERTRTTSPYYASWVEDARTLAEQGIEAIEQRDIEKLGTAARLSYQRMFATMFAADPPILYWLPASVEAQHRAARLRDKGIAAWETMDAGPQVKILTTEADADRVVQSMRDLAQLPPLVCGVGPGVSVELGAKRPAAAPAPGTTSSDPRPGEQH